MKIVRVSAEKAVRVGGGHCREFSPEKWVLKDSSDYASSVCPLRKGRCGELHPDTGSYSSLRASGLGSGAEC